MEIKHLLSCVDVSKAEIFGKSYIIDEIIYNLTEKTRKRKELTRLSNYVCKSLQLIPQGKYLTEDVSTIFDKKEEVSRSANEIIDDVFGRIGIMRIKDNGN